MNRINNSFDGGIRMHTPPNYYLFQGTSNIGQHHQQQHHVPPQDALTTSAHTTHHHPLYATQAAHRQDSASTNMSLAWPHTATSIYDHRSPPMQSFDGASGATDFDGMMEKDMQQFPSVDEFEAIVQGYLDNLSTKKRDKALVDGHRYSLIVRVLKDPRNTAISTAQFRFWVKKMFQLVALPTGQDIVCHDSKPVAMREDIYGILVRAHKQANHGGRDKTSAIVRRRYSWIPKELIARFVRHCPYCIARRIGSQSPPIGLLPRTPPDEGAEDTVVAAAAAAAVANSHRPRHVEMHQNHPLAELSYLPVNDKDLGIDCWTTAAHPPPGCYSPTTTSPSSSVSGPSSISQQHHQQQQHAFSTAVSSSSVMVTQHHQQQPSMLLSPCGIPSATLDAPQHVDHHHHPQQQQQHPSFNMCYHAPPPHSTSPEDQILTFSSTTSSTSPTTAITPPPVSASRHHHQRYVHDTPPSYYYAQPPPPPSYMTSMRTANKGNNNDDAAVAVVPVEPSNHSPSSSSRQTTAMYHPNTSTTHVMMGQSHAPPPSLRNF